MVIFKFCRAIIIFGYSYPLTIVIVFCLFSIQTLNVSLSTCVLHSVLWTVSCISLFSHGFSGLIFYCTAYMHSVFLHISTTYLAFYVHIEFYHLRSHQDSLPVTLVFVFISPVMLGFYLLLWVFLGFITSYSGVCHDIRGRASHSWFLDWLSSQWCFYQLLVAYLYSQFLGLLYFSCQKSPW